MDLTLLGDIYVTDSYGNARVHRFTRRDGRFVKSLGGAGPRCRPVPLPRGIAFDDAGKRCVADRSNKRVQILTPEGEFLGQWTGMGGPNDISRGKEGITTLLSRRARASPPISASAMTTAMCSPSSRAAMSMVWVSTRAATSTLG